MKNTQIYHLNDRTMKYQTMAQSKRQHQYLGLPGEYKRSLPQEMIFPNLDSQEQMLFTAPMKDY